MVIVAGRGLVVRLGDGLEPHRFRDSPVSPMQVGELYVAVIEEQVRIQQLAAERRQEQLHRQDVEHEPSVRKDRPHQPIIALGSVLHGVSTRRSSGYERSKDHLSGRDFEEIPRIEFDRHGHALVGAFMYIKVPPSAMNSATPTSRHSSRNDASSDENVIARK